MVKCGERTSFSFFLWERKELFLVFHGEDERGDNLHEILQEINREAQPRGRECARGLVLSLIQYVLHTPKTRTHPHPDSFRFLVSHTLLQAGTKYVNGRKKSSQYSRTSLNRCLLFAFNGKNHAHTKISIPLNLLLTRSTRYNPHYVRDIYCLDYP